MGVTVTTPAPSSSLTTRARVVREVELTSAADEETVDTLIREASAAIVRHCHREFAREAVTELLPGFGDIHLQLTRTPIVVVSSVSVNGNLVTDYAIADRLKGWLYRRAGWSWSVQPFMGLGGGGAWLDWGTPMPRQEEPQISVPYTGGYILPAQQHVAAVTLSAAAADNSFNDSANGFPALLKAGDIIEVQGFANPGNNGRFVVAGTPTTAKVQVSATLTLEAAAPAVTVTYPDPTGLPLEVEKAAVEAVKSWWLARTDDSRVVEKQLGPARLRYEEGLADRAGLPPQCIGLLRPWVRLA